MGRDVAGARHAGRLKGGEQVHKTCIRVLPVQRARRKGQGEDGKLGYHTLGAKTRVPGGVRMATGSKPEISVQVSYSRRIASLR